MSENRISGTEGYDVEAASLLERYEKRRFEEVHEAVFHLFPVSPTAVVDIGAGTGRDAAWFAEMGHSVVAVEPTREMREPAKLLHPSSAIRWIDDGLPDLKVLRRLEDTFDVVMMNAVWMHLDKEQRSIGMPTIAAITNPGARVFMTLRHGPVPQGRRMFEVSADETVDLADHAGFRTLWNDHTESIQPENRSAGVTWTRLVFEKVR